MQGEGLYVGASTLFVRFGECDLRCAWCDSPQTWRPAASCRVETSPGRARFRKLPNPLRLELVEQCLEELDLKRHRFVSLTGGEPLLQPQAVAALARSLRRRGNAVYLETHGLATNALASLIDEIDVVSMDWKLASDVRRASDPRQGEAVADFHAAHEGFLRVAQRAGKCFVKVVLTPNTRDEELDEVCRRMALCSPGTPLVLQPVTPYGSVRETPEAEQLLSWVRRCERHMGDVRLIPQTHRIYDAL